jgi:hypothetical protein
MTRQRANVLPAGTMHVHKQIAEVAKAAAHEYFDSMMTGSNKLYWDLKNAHPDMTVKQLDDWFVEHNWGKFIPFARATLAALLAQPIDPALKEDIYDALCKDATLTRGRKSSAQNIADILRRTGHATQQKG